MLFGLYLPVSFSLAILSSSQLGGLFRRSHGHFSYIICCFVVYGLFMLNAPVCSCAVLVAEQQVVVLYDFVRDHAADEVAAVAALFAVVYFVIFVHLTASHRLKRQNSITPT